MIEFLRNIYFKMSDLSEFDCDRVLKTTGFCLSPLSTDLTAAPCISYENCQKIPASTLSPLTVSDIDISTKILIGLGLVLTAGRFLTPKSSYLNNYFNFIVHFFCHLKICFDHKMSLTKVVQH